MRWGRKGQWVLFEKTVIGPTENPYMLRWRLFECPLFRVYLHKICRSDDDRHLHDHPFNFWSLILRGGYAEYRPGPHPCRRCEPFNICGRVEKLDGLIFIRWFGAGSFIRRRAADLHRIELATLTTSLEPLEQEGKPAWTLVLAGRRIREWGFETENGWVSHQDYFNRDFVAVEGESHAR